MDIEIYITFAYIAYVHSVSFLYHMTYDVTELAILSIYRSAISNANKTHINRICVTSLDLDREGARLDRAK